MDPADQFIEIAPTVARLNLHCQPPTPMSMAGDFPTSAFMAPSSSVSSISSGPLPIPFSSSRPSSRPSSRGGTPSLSRSNSTRHHPYGSPASFSERPVRPRSATTASYNSDWETDASNFDIYGSSVDSSCHTPASSYGLPSAGLQSDLPVFPTDSPFVAGNSPRGKGGRAAKSHARKTAPGHIKRPPNAFILFRSHCCSPSVANADPSIPEPPGTAHARHLASLDISNSQHISVIVSKVWKGLSTEDKAYWNQKADEAKEEHQRLHPDYRYRPRQRKKDEIRRRKQVDPQENQEHREACNEVARQVLEIERERQGLGPKPLFRDDAEADLDVSPSPPAPKAAPKKKRTRKAPARAAYAAASPEGMFPLDLPEPSDLPTPTFGAPHAFPSRPQTAQSASYGAPETFGSYSLHAPPATASYDSQPRSAPVYQDQQFAFSAQLDAVLAHGLPSSASSALDPQPAQLDLNRPGTAFSSASPPSNLVHSTFDPAFSMAPASAPPTSTFTLPIPELPRPPSPRSAAIQQMQHYTLGGPSASPAPFSSSLPPVGLAPMPQQPIQLSPTGTTFAFGTTGPAVIDGALPLAQRRAGDAPAPLPLDALKQRRGTIRPGNLSGGGGNLMLISPMTSTFGGRKQSTGTWSTGLRRLSLAGGDEAFNGARRSSLARSALGSGVISSTETFETVTFPQDMLETLPMEDPLVSAEFFSQFTSTPEMGYEADGGELTRPTTASSEWSTDGEVERLEGELPEGFMGRRRSTIVPSKFISTFSTSAAPSSVPFSAPATNGSFHVGPTDFFDAPPPALASAGAVTSSSSPTSPPAVPAFGSAQFGNSFQPYADRPSVDSMLSAVAAEQQPVYQGYAPTPSPLASGVPSPDVPISVNGSEDEWLASAETATASSMRSTALSILQQRRHQQEMGAPAGFEMAGDAAAVEPARDEVEYIFLSAEQLTDTALLTEIQANGYGIAFDPSAPPSAVSSPTYQLPAAETLSLGNSPLFAHSATF